MSSCSGRPRRSSSSAWPRRPTTPTGKQPDELAQVLGYLETVEPLLRRGASSEIDTSVPVARVVEAILAQVGR